MWLKSVLSSTVSDFLFFFWFWSLFSFLWNLLKVRGIHEWKNWNLPKLRMWLATVCHLERLKSKIVEVRCWFESFWVWERLFEILQIWLLRFFFVLFASLLFFTAPLSPSTGIAAVDNGPGVRVHVETTKLGAHAVARRRLKDEPIVVSHYVRSRRLHTRMHPGYPRPLPVDQVKFPHII